MVAIICVCLRELSIARGFLLGSCFSIINFSLLERTITKTLGHSRSGATIRAFSSIFLRYIILAIPIIIAIKLIAFNLVAVIIGIFSVQIVMLVYYIVIRRFTE